MFYDIYDELCRKKGIAPKAAAIEMGLSNSLPTKWKKTGATPRGKTLKTIAAYFGVSESYLLRDEKNQPDDDHDELMEELQILRDNPATRTLLHASKNLTAEQVKKMAEMILSMQEE